MSISPSGQTAEGKGVEPSSHVSGNRLSRAARPTVSAYLPFHLVDPPGIEPESPACRTGIFPLDDEPIVLSVDRRGIEPRFPACGAGVVP
jgi:hypothetical protein